MKITDRVDVPLVLDLGPFMAGGEGQRQTIMPHAYLCLGCDEICEEGCFVIHTSLYNKGP